MSSVYGVTPEGFVEKPLEDALEEIQDDQKAAFGPAFDVSADGTAGQLNGIFGDQIAQLWEVAAAIYRALYPDSASDEALDNVAAITGALRLAPTKTQAPLSLNLSSGVTVPAGSTVEISATGDRFDTLVDATNAGGDPASIAVTAEAQQTGAIDANSGAIDTIVTPISGWSAQAAVENANSETYVLVDGQTLTIKVDGESVAQTATFNTADFGDIANATAAEVALVIDTDIVGLSAVDVSGKVRLESDTDGAGSSLQITGGTANAVLGFPTTLKAGINPDSDEDVLGTSLEEDVDFRIRRENTIRVQGSATVEAIRSDMLDVNGVLEAFVFKNDDDVTDADGLPPHSVEAVVDAPGVTDLTLATALFNSVAGGIKAHGATSQIVVDSQGFDQTVEFSRSRDVEVYMDITLVKNTDTTKGPIYPSDGDAQVKAALVDKGNETGIGDNAIFEVIKCAALTVSGVIDIVSFFMEGVFSEALSGSSETFALSDGETLLVKVDGGAAQTATFNTGDFGDIANATAAEVAAVITTDITGATASDASGQVEIVSDAVDAIEITGGTANGALAFPTPGTPTATINIPILNREQAKFDTTRTTVA